MKVILPADSLRQPLTGIGRYTFELVQSLQNLSEIDLYLLQNGRLDRVEQGSEPQGTSSAVVNTSTLRQTLRHSYLAQVAHRNLVAFKQWRALKGNPGALYHGTNFFLPRFSGPCVVTIHDLSVFTWSHCHPAARVKIMQKEILNSLDRAQVLITDSEFIRLELAAYFSLPLEKIRTVPLACSSTYHPRSAEESGAVLRKYGLLWQGYSFFASTIEPRKNIDGLLDAYSKLPLKIRKECPLVLCGSPGWQSADLHKKIEKAEWEGWVRYLGFVPIEDLPFLYASARLFVYPSFYEGFGLPVLEAMASGVPIVCSNAASLPEVVAGSALMCEPSDLETFAGMITRGLQDEGWRAAARELGLARAENFSWSRCAEETVSAYHEAYGEIT